MMNSTATMKYDETRPADGGPAQDEALRELISRARLGDGDAMAEIIERCRKIIFHHINRMAIDAGIIDRDDLEQEAQIAVIEAIQACNTDNFEAVVWNQVKWRLAAVLRSDNVLSGLGRTDREIRRARKAIGEDTSVEDLAGHIGYSNATIRRAVSAAQSAASLDAPRGDTDLYNVIMAGFRPTEDAALEIIYHEEFNMALKGALEILTETQQQVVANRLAGMTFAESADAIGKTESAIKNQWRYAKEKLARVLIDYRPAPARKVHGVQTHRRSTGLRYQAHIWAGGEHLTLGTFDSEREAALAYDRAVIEYGVNSELNYPELAQAA